MQSYTKKETVHGTSIYLCQDWAIRAEQLPPPEDVGDLLLHLFQNKDTSINPNVPVPSHTLDFIALQLLFSVVKKNQLKISPREEQWIVSGEQPSQSYNKSAHTPVILASDFSAMDTSNINRTVSQAITVSADSKNAYSTSESPDRGLLFAFNTNGQMTCLYFFSIPRASDEAKKIKHVRPLLPIGDFTRVHSIVNLDPRTLPDRDTNRLPAIKLWRRETIDRQYFTLTASLGLGMPFGPLIDTLQFNHLGR